jgi:carbonic anhydrase
VRSPSVIWTVTSILTELQHRPEGLQELKSLNLDFLPFPELDQAVKDDVKFLEASKLLPSSITISGWVYEVETGKTRRLV